MRAFIFDKGIDKAPLEVTQYMVYPYGAEYSYDDSLGSACLLLRNMTYGEAYAPGTIVFVGEDNYTSVFNDQWTVVDSTCVKNENSGLYSHTLYLCDLTKLLERDVIGNKTFTRSIVRGAITGPKTIQPFVIDTNIDYVGDNSGVFYCNNTRYQSPWFTNLIRVDTFSLVFPNYLLGSFGDIYSRAVYFNGKIVFRNKITLEALEIGAPLGGTAEIIDKNGNKTTSTMTLAEWIAWDDQTSSVNISGSGVVEIEWVIEGESLVESNTRTLYASISKQVQKTQADPPNPSLLEACTILANISERKRGYHITVEAADVVARREMGEEICDIDITGGTLREAIDTTAGVGGCFCRYRLEYQANSGKFAHKIKLHTINRNVAAKLDQLGQPIITRAQDSIEGACSALDSSVSNLMNLTQGGALVDPSSNAWTSLRSETVRITEQNCEIPTKYPIYTIDKVEVAYGDYSADITHFIYEETEYSMLSSFAPAYPRSKAYALYYTRGQKSIKGLSFEHESAISQLLVSPSIVNICNASFGTSFKDFGVKKNMLKYPDLKFRVSYVPVSKMRIRQSKPNMADAMTDNVLTYNQSATHVDSVRYGRNLAGAVERSGQPSKKITYKTYVGASIPAPGEMYDNDYMISKITTQRSKDYTTVQLQLTKWYNRLNPFIGIDSAQRLFEISENGYVPRTIMHEDYCIISDAVQSGEYSLITSDGLTGFDRAFSGGATATGEYTPQVAYLQGQSKTEGALTVCALPIVSCGIGRSLVYSFGYEDNYSAGDKAISAERYTDLYRLKEAVPYSDSFGEIEYMRIELADRTDTNKLNADDLPEAPSGISSRAIFAIDDLYVHKDSREQLLFSYQIHFVTPKSNWIVSPAIAESFQMVAPRPANLNRRVGLYRLSYELSRTDTTIKLNEATRQTWKRDGEALSFPLKVASNDVLMIPNDLVGQKFDGDGKAWAIAYDDGKLLWGCNTQITSDTVIPRFCLSFRHRATT